MQRRGGSPVYSIPQPHKWKAVVVLPRRDVQPPRHPRGSPPAPRGGLRTLQALPRQLRSDGQSAAEGRLHAAFGELDVTASDINGMTAETFFPSSLLPQPARAPSTPTPAWGPLGGLGLAGGVRDRLLPSSSSNIQCPKQLRTEATGEARGLRRGTKEGRDGRCRFTPSFSRNAC